MALLVKKKNPLAKAGDLGETGSIPGLWRSPGEGNGNPLKYSCLENSMEKGAWWATVRGVVKSQTWLSNLVRCTGVRWLRTLIVPWLSALAMQEIAQQKVHRQAELSPVCFGSVRSMGNFFWRQSIETDKLMSSRARGPSSTNKRV